MGFAEALQDEEEVTIAFDKKDGNRRAIPIWFTLNGNVLELLPMYGLKTKWFQDVQSSGDFEVKVKQESMTVSPRMVREPKKVDEIKKRFGVKYGNGDVERYYPTSEIALEVSL